MADQFKLDEVPEAVVDAVAEAIGGSAYDCTRCWSAWRVGTMSAQDFHGVADDGDRVAEIARAAIVAWEAEKAKPADDFAGWYCAHCQRGVDGSEVTFREQHLECGRVITSDRPPAVDWGRYGVALAFAVKGMREAGGISNNKVADKLDELAAKLESMQVALPSPDPLCAAKTAGCNFPKCGCTEDGPAPAATGVSGG